MIHCDNSALHALALHIVGNKLRDNGLCKSARLIDLDDSLRKVMVQYFMTSFTIDERFCFSHHSGLDFNVVFQIASKVFDEPDKLLMYSTQLAEHLYESSTHVNIKGGEFYVAYFHYIEFDGLVTRAIGLFKSETKNTFLRIIAKDGSSTLKYEDGVDIRKLDKGCLIFNTQKEDGYVVAVIDNTNKSDAKYWVEDFLGVKPRQDKYFQTQNIMSVCKSFVTKQLPSEFEVSKADQAEILNRSVQYFKDNDEFNLRSFTETVLEHPRVIDSFQSYKERYQTERDIEIEDSFVISNDAVKKQARSFKSVIKLDKNFHIYVHGNRNLIEQGEDEKGRYYKVYYNEEY